MSDVKSRIYKEELKRLLEKLEKCENSFKFSKKGVESIQQFDSHFDDGIRRIDFVLVYDYANNYNSKAKVNLFIKHLEQAGLEFEGYKSKVNPELLFIKVHGPTQMLLKRASVFDLTLSFENDNEVMHSDKFKCLEFFMHTELTSPNVNSNVYKRAVESVSGARPKQITTAERIMLVYDLLKIAKYGPKSHEFGVDALVQEKSLVAAYPLHDGRYNWSEEGPLNDRQLLSEFWARAKIKYQPLDLIHKYYGPEVGFYFAFYGFYNKMLVVASLMGMISILYGIITFSDEEMNYASTSICNSKAIVCPYCSHSELCRVEEMKTYCFLSKVSYIIDNTGTFCYAILMCFWATVFLEVWSRKQKILMYKWNLLSVEDDFNLRHDFIVKAKCWRKSKYEDRLVPYEKFWMKFLKFSISCIIIQVFIIALIALIFGTILMRLFLRYHMIKSVDITHSTIIFRNIQLISTMIVNGIIITIMLSCELFFGVLARVLTDLENPRTQSEYDKLYIYKMYALIFLNSYGSMYYTSFCKGAFFTYPGDLDQFDGYRIIKADNCGPLGCILQISMQLAMTIMGKIGIKFCFSHALFYLRRYVQRHKRKTTHEMFSSFPFFESSLSDHNTRYYFLLKEYREIIIQYGYIVLFTAAFPLTPLLALISNLVDIRIDAYKFTKFYRRPVPVRTCGIGAWNSVINTLTYIGIVTNAFLIAFSTHFIPDMIKNFGKEYYQGDFVEFSFSNFSIDDYDHHFDKVLNERRDNTTKHCLYYGKRHPPSHENKYNYRIDHWYEMSIRFIAVLVLEVLVKSFTALLAFAIADIPRPIKEYMIAKQKAEREEKQNEIKEAFRKSLMSETY